MPRSIDGHGLAMLKKPPPCARACPSSLRICASTPGNGKPAEPGFAGCNPGRVVIMILPVSVCHHVSTIGHLHKPMYSWYHIHASGLMGSPTLPSRRSEDRLYFL